MTGPRSASDDATASYRLNCPSRQSLAPGSSVSASIRRRSTSLDPWRVTCRISSRAPAGRSGSRRRTRVRGESSGRQRWRRCVLAVRPPGSSRAAMRADPGNRLGGRPRWSVEGPNPDVLGRTAVRQARGGEARLPLTTYPHQRAVEPENHSLTLTGYGDGAASHPASIGHSRCEPAAPATACGVDLRPGSDADYMDPRSWDSRAALPPTALYSHRFGSRLGRPGTPRVGMRKWVCVTCSPPVARSLRADTRTRPD